MYAKGGAEPIGETTSGGLSPSLEAGIGMAYLPDEMAKPGEVIEIDIRGSAFRGGGGKESRSTNAAPNVRSRRATRRHFFLSYLQLPPYLLSFRPYLLMSNVPDNLKFAPTHEWLRAR